MATFKVHESFLYAVENPGADHRSNLNKLVKLGADGSVALGGAGDKVLGVVYETNTEGSDPYGPVTIQFAGIAKIIAGGAIDIGDEVQCGSNGLAAAGSTNAIGVALSKTTGANQLVTVALIG